MTDQPAAPPLPFARLMGVEITRAAPDAVEGRLLVREDLCTTRNILHGGAVMAFADTLGAVGAFLNLPEGASGTTTIESKTNFLGAARQGETVTAVARPVHVGRRTSVWQTELRGPDGGKIALVTQTQLVL